MNRRPRKAGEVGVDEGGLAGVAQAESRATLTEKGQLLVDGNPVFEPPFVMSESGVGFAPFAFEVDADVPVHRSEVWERISENERVGGQTGEPCLPAE